MSTYYLSITAYYYERKYCLYPKLHRKIQKFIAILEKTFACGRLKFLLHSACLLQSEFQTII